MQHKASTLMEVYPKQRPHVGVLLHHHQIIPVLVGSQALLQTSVGSYICLGRREAGGTMGNQCSEGLQMQLWGLVLAFAPYTYVLPAACARWHQGPCKYGKPGACCNFDGPVGCTYN